MRGHHDRTLRPARRDLTSATTGSFSTRASALSRMQAIAEDQELDAAPHTCGPVAGNVVLEGVVVSRSVRSSFASLVLASTENDPEEPFTLVRLQFMDQLQDLRSYCRRFCKLGDSMVIYEAAGSASFAPVDEGVATDWQAPRLVVNLDDTKHAQRSLRVRTSRLWSVNQVQAFQRQHLPHLHINPGPKLKRKGKDTPTSNRTCNFHKTGLSKRQQAENLANVLVNMVAGLVEQRDDPVATDTWATEAPVDASMSNIREWLNRGTGVVDAAGGSGHVSMALGLRGIQSTVVDPRLNVGHLPGRDRKIWKQAFRRNMDVNYCQPVQYQVMRALFGETPEFRHDDQADLPVIGRQAAASKSTSDSDFSNKLLEQASAIVALHPDEATDAIVDSAVRFRKPFVIVPCCVFARLFPHRRLRNKPVSTHEELLEYLQAKHPSIRLTVLPFPGANTALWSIFDKD